MVDISSSYLKKLKYDKGLEKKLIAKYLVNPRLVFLLTIAIVVLGLFSLSNLSRTLNPKVDITFVNVITTLPGASPTEIESLVTIPIEDSLTDVDHGKKISSISQDSVSIVSVEFESGSDRKQAGLDVQRVIDSIDNFPKDAVNPKVSVFDFEDQPVIVASISSKNDFASLNSLALNVKDILEESRDIDRVVITGGETEEVQIEIRPEVVAQYKLNSLQLQQLIKSSLKSFPAGQLADDNNVFSLSIEKAISSIEDVRQLPININGNIVTLSDMAEISLRPKPAQLTSYSTNGSSIDRSVVISVFKSRNTKIDEVAGLAQEIMKEELNKYSGYEYTISIDLSEEITDQFNSLTVSFTQTLILVFLTLLIFFGFRKSIIVALSIPLTFLISFTVMSLAGLTINFLSVFSLLLALGLLVDDAIVIVSAINSYFRTGKFTSKETGLLVWKDFITPIWSTTITTVWAFVPLLLASGIIGAFIKTIPIIVSATLIASTAVAVLITLPISMYLLDMSVPKRVVYFVRALGFALFVSLFVYVVPSNPKPLFVFGLIAYVLFLLITFDARKDMGDRISSILNVNGGSGVGWLRNGFKNGFVNPQRISDKYKTIIGRITKSKSSRRRVVVAVIFFSFVSYILLPLGIVKNEFFPAISTDTVFIALEMPASTSYTATENKGVKIMNDIAEVGGMKFALLEIGKLPNQFGVVSSEGENTARFTINLEEENSVEMASIYRDKFANYTVGKISVIVDSGGPPVGPDVQLTLVGDDLPTLSEKSDEVVTFLKSQDNITNVSKSILPSVSKITFVPDNKKIAQRGISIEQIGFSVRSMISGLEVDTLDTNGSERDIVIRSSKSRLKPEEVGLITVQTPTGLYPLNDLGSLVPAVNPSIITRESGKRTITVTASVDGVSIPEANKTVAQFAEEDLDLPLGYEWKTGGANEENQGSVNSILQAMIIAAILILATMVIQLGSFRKAVIVLLVIPLAVSGVFIAFAVTSTPLSFPALIGLLALFGIVVNNSIIVVEKMNQNLRADIKFSESVADGAASRVEPIMFSSLTTIFGLLPITLSDPLWRGLGGAIIAGLLVSGTIMLFFIPVVYYSWFKD